MRQPEQGNGEAQSAARDLIEDLAPRLILVVGIAGGLPSKGYTLGDVILSLRILDYSVEARKEGHDTTYATSGGPVGKHIEHHVANLGARLKDLGNWTECLPERPPIILKEANFYGSDDWKREVRESLEYHSASNARIPNFCSGKIASSDRLIKDTEILILWLQTNRDLLAVEMESGGVYRAIRERCAMLAIRGISDIVGLKREERWTQYACASAAAFARAYLRTTPIDVVGRPR
jgi:nucleoside phosphorylase